MNPGRQSEYNVHWWKYTKTFKNKTKIKIENIKTKIKYIKKIYNNNNLTQTPEIGQGLGDFLRCGARKLEQNIKTIKT